MTCGTLATGALHRESVKRRWMQLLQVQSGWPQGTLDPFYVDLMDEILDLLCSAAEAPSIPSRADATNAVAASKRNPTHCPLLMLLPLLRIGKKVLREADLDGETKDSKLFLEDKGKPRNELIRIFDLIARREIDFACSDCPGSDPRCLELQLRYCCG